MASDTMGEIAGDLEALERRHDETRRQAVKGPPSFGTITLRQDLHESRDREVDELMARSLDAIWREISSARRLVVRFLIGLIGVLGMACLTLILRLYPMPDLSHSGGGAGTAAAATLEHTR